MQRSQLNASRVWDLEQAPIDRNARGSAPRLLVIARDPSLWAMVTGMISAPWQVIEAETGAEALAAIVRGERFAAILCDANLPDFGALALHEAIGVVAPLQAARMTITSSVMHGWDLAVLARRGFVRVLTRPFTEAVFHKVLRAPVKLRKGARPRVK